MTNPVVSVCMITYNHETFIAQAIESVLMQKTNFQFELVIGEDCSTDNTKKICDDYQKKHPQLIKLLSSDGNLGVNKNFIRTLKKCKGKYIATLEGDDYWTDINKLQTQFNYLENNPSVPICFTDYDTINEKGDIIETNCLKKNNFKKRLIINDILSFKVPPVRTTFFRTKYLPDFNHKIWYEINGIDTLFFSLITNNETAHFINKNTAVWRFHSGGVYSMKDKILKYENILIDLKKYSFFFQSIEIKKIITDLIYKYYIILIKISFREKHYFKSVRYYFSLLFLDIKLCRNQWTMFNLSLFRKALTNG